MLSGGGSTRSGCLKIKYLSDWMSLDLEAVHRGANEDPKASGTISTPAPVRAGKPALRCWSAGRPSHHEHREAGGKPSNFSYLDVLTSKLSGSD